MPSVDFQLFDDHLAWCIAIPYLVTCLIAFATRKAPRSEWFSERTVPIFSLSACYIFAVLIATLSIKIISFLGWSGRFTEAFHSAGTISGPDLIINLLTSVPTLTD